MTLRDLMEVCELKGKRTLGSALCLDPATWAEIARQLRLALEHEGAWMEPAREETDARS